MNSISVHNLTEIGPDLYVFDIRSENGKKLRKKGNDFRRIVASEITSYAISTVNFLTNTTHIENEFIACRVGQIKFKISGDYTETRKNNKIYLHKTCDEKSTSGKWILARDFMTFDGDIEIINDLDAILYLRSGQTLHIECVLEEGAQKYSREELYLNQAKFNPVHHCGFYNRTKNEITCLLDIDGRKRADEIIHEALLKYESKYSARNQLAI